MSSKSRQSKSGHQTKGAFGGIKGKIKKAQMRFLATRQMKGKRNDKGHK
jgi:hypothetical protein